MKRKKELAVNRIGIEDGDPLKLLLEDPNIKEAFRENILSEQRIPLKVLLEDPNLKEAFREKILSEQKEEQKAKKKKYTIEEYNIYDDCLIYPRTNKDNTKKFDEILKELKHIGLIKAKITKKNNKIIETPCWCGTKKSFAMFCYVVAQNLFFSHKKQPYSYFIALIKDKQGKDFNPVSLSKYKGEYVAINKAEIKLDSILREKLGDCFKCLDK